MVRVRASLRFVDEVIACETGNFGCSNGSCFCADALLESHRRGDQDDTRRKLEMAMAKGNGASQTQWCRDKLRATRATQTRIVEQDDETYRISSARVDFD